MQCPKCKNNQVSEVACESCGIIFSNYYKSLLRQERLELEELNIRQGRNHKPLLMGGVILIGIVLTLFLNNETDSTADSTKSDSTHQRPQLMGEQALYEEYLRSSEQDKEISSKIASAIFTISESRKQSTALMVTKGCLAITTKSSLKKKTKNYSERNNQLTIDRIQDDMRSLRDQIEVKRQTFISECEDCSQSAFANKVQRLDRKLERKERELSKAYEKADRPKKPDNQISIYYKNGRQDARVVAKSSSLDLALITTDSSECTMAAIGDSSALQIGDEVYSINAKLRISKGTFQGFKTNPEGYRLLLHSGGAGYSSGYSGTPIVNKAGEVVAINYPHMGKPRRAIPIEVALKELNVVY